MKRNFTKPNKSTKYWKISLVFFGIFLCLVLLEIGLRIGGIVLLSMQERRNMAGFQAKDAYRIMCLGESTTYDGSEYSYPSQLQEILNLKNLGIKFKVINKGVSGFDSAYILANLENNLDKYQPQMVVVMMGINDVKDTVPYEDSWETKSILFLKGFRIYKLARLIKLHIAEHFIDQSADADRGSRKLGKINDNEIELVAGHRYSVQDYLYLYYIYSTRQDFKKTEQLLKEAINIYPTADALYVTLGDEYILQGRYGEAEKMLSKAIEINPQSGWAYSILGRCYTKQDKFEDAERVLKKSLTITPAQPHLYEELYRCYTSCGQMQKLERLAEDIIEQNIEDEWFLGFLATIYNTIGKQNEAETFYKKAESLEMQSYNAPTMFNYRKLKEIILQRSIKLVCVQYPMRSLKPLKKLFGSTDNILFVNNEMIFKEVLRRGQYTEYFTDTFAGDFGHCTSKGNRILANNIANAIIKEYFKK
ncbi:MAG: tetratricopeptide repeat protein [Candidatus Omnitrophica bacterium]|nr:tetratricopeptide repeat protein [Candidatus Omnitrophota bacterium]MBU1924481.1 tetratricopeptide repeat protein [Candidatus Omnitrophota bacterium]